MAVLTIILTLAALSGAAASGECAASSAEYLHGFDKFELTYFDGRGLAEVRRNHVTRFRHRHEL